MISTTPPPPYYAVIFSTIPSNNLEGYPDMADQMIQLAKNQPGYLGYESAHSDIRITISYWKDLDAIRQWKNQPAHQIAQKLGKKKWYKAFKVRICKVERAYDFEQLNP